MKRRLRTLGRYPDLSLAEARKEARRVMAELDFEAPAIAQRPSMHFAEARDRFLAEAAQRNKPRTVKDYRRLLFRHFSFDRPVAEVTRRDVMQVVEGLAATPSEQSHAFVAIRTLLNWCVRQGILEQTPLPPLRQTAASRDRVLTEPEVSEVYRKAGEAAWPFGPILRLLILTGQRRSEIGALRWDWVDVNRIVFPKVFTKNRREHVLPLGPIAQDLLAALPRVGESGFVFSARGEAPGSFNGWGKAKARFDATLEDVGPYTLHDLRRTFSSLHAKIGTPIHVTEKLLNHVSGTVSGVAAVYNRHSYLDEMRAAMAAYEAHLAGLTGP